MAVGKDDIGKTLQVPHTEIGRASQQEHVSLVPNRGGLPFHLQVYSLRWSPALPRHAVCAQQIFEHVLMTFPEEPSRLERQTNKFRG